MESPLQEERMLQEGENNANNTFCVINFSI